jgi:hypothetical protein
MIKEGFWAVVALVFTISIAQANVIYDWVPTHQIGAPGLLSIGELVFTDAAVASGSFSSSCVSPTVGCALPSGLVSIRGIGSQPPIALFNLEVTFNADGTLSNLSTNTMGITNFTDAGAEFFVSGSGITWSGTMNSESLQCGDPRPCQVLGYWERQAVPEPASFGLFGAALVGLGIAYRFRRTPT